VSDGLARQRWLGAIALAVALPLPFTGVVSVPFLVPFVVVAAWMVAARRQVASLPAWAENLLAPAVLLAVVAAGGLRFGILRPVAQLAVAVAAIRLFGCHDPARARRTALLLALVGTAGIASSTHPLLAFYLLGLLAMVVVAVGHLELNARGHGRRRVAVWPPARVVAGTVVIAALVAAPLFVLLPRLRSPFAAAPFGSRPVSGFRDAVALHRIGDVKLSTSVALRVRFADAAAADPEWLRLAGTSLQRYRNGVWAQAQMRRTPLVAGADGDVRLADASGAGRRVRAEITLEKRSDSLFLPLGTTALRLPMGLEAGRGPLGEVRIPRWTDVPLTYEVEFAPGAVAVPPPQPGDLQLAEGTEAVAELARQVAGGARTPVAAALALEAHLRRNYAYSTSTFAPMREDPVTWFLFQRGEGHCEFFASSMVLLLRAVGVPARMQAGYAGGELTDAGEYLVRDAEAHAWVVAWLAPTWEGLDELRARLASGEPPPPGSWRLFDPTPAEGRPGLGRAPGLFRVDLSWQRVEQLWDRWVLTFSLADQLDVLQAAVASGARATRWALTGAAAVALAVLAAGRARALARRRRRRAGAVRTAAGAALARVTDAARRAGVTLPDCPTPRQLARDISARRPEVAAPVHWLVDRHEVEAYAGGPAAPKGEVRRATRDVLRVLGRRVAA